MQLIEGATKVKKSEPRDARGIFRIRGAMASSNYEGTD